MRSTPFDGTVRGVFSTDQVNPHRTLWRGACGAVRCGAVRIFLGGKPTVRCDAMGSGFVKRRIVGCATVR